MYVHTLYSGCHSADTEGERREVRVNTVDMYVLYMCACYITFGKDAEKIHLLYRIPRVQPEVSIQRIH